MKKLVLLTVVSLLLSSCLVSKKKFDDMLAQKVKTESELNDKTTELDALNKNYSKQKQILRN